MPSVSSWYWSNHKDFQWLKNLYCIIYLQVMQWKRWVNNCKNTVSFIEWHQNYPREPKINVINKITNTLDCVGCRTKAQGSSLLFSLVKSCSIRWKEGKASLFFCLSSVSFPPSNSSLLWFLLVLFLALFFFWSTVTHKKWKELLGRTEIHSPVMWHGRIIQPESLLCFGQQQKELPA